jgi:SAM-dependent methyltransferase
VSSEKIHPQVLATEAERIRRVYRAYDADRGVRSRWSAANPGNQASVDEVLGWFRRQLDTSHDLPLGERRILDLGCGHGDILARMLEFGARPENLYGVDVLPDRIESCTRTYPESNFACQNGADLAYPDGHFDVIVICKVLSSIRDDAVRSAVAREVKRVLAPGGAVLWWDLRYPNPWNPEVRPVSSREIKALFHGLDTHLVGITLLPAVARRLGRTTAKLYPLLASVPLLCSHWAGVLRKAREELGNTPYPADGRPVLT